MILNRIFSLVFGFTLLATTTASSTPLERDRTFSPAVAINKELEAAVNTQIGHELEAAYLYLAVANSFEQKSLFGFSHWFSVQFFEEITHARLMMKFLSDRGNRVQLKTLEPIALKEEMTALEASALGLTAEEQQTERIHTLYELSRTAKAYDLENMLAFFVREQVQEESSFMDLVQRLKIIGNSPEGLLALDRELLMRPVPVVQPLPVIGP